jgi:hypothetical protein
VTEKSSAAPMPAALIACPDRPKNFIINIPFWNDVRLSRTSRHIEGLVFRACVRFKPGRARMAGPQALSSRPGAGFLLFPAVSSQKAGQHRCSSATGAQQNATCQNYDVVSTSYICQGRSGGSPDLVGVVPIWPHLPALVPSPVSLSPRQLTIRTIRSRRPPCAVRDRCDSAVRMKEYNA